jgi:predicted transposase YbfD/YdcC
MLPAYPAAPASTASGRCICSPRWTTPTAWSWRNGRSTAHPARSPRSVRCWPGLDLTGVVVTADALHTQREHAEFLVTGKQAGYLFIVKGNQPALHAQLGALPWRDIPVLDRTRDHGHGRVEVRTLKVATVAGLGFPHAAQALRITRRVRSIRSRRWRAVTVYAVTSLTAAQASPARLADWIRGHWGIEICQADCAYGM